MENLVTKNEFKQNGLKRGCIYIAALGRDVVGSEQGGKRPVLVLQNDIGNKYSPTVIVAALTTKAPRKPQKTQVLLKKEDHEGLVQDCYVMLEQIKTISKERIEIHDPVATISRDGMKKVEIAMLLSLGMSM